MPLPTHGCHRYVPNGEYIPVAPECPPNGERQPEMWIPRHNGRKRYAPLPAVNLYGHRKVYKWLFHDTSGSPPEWHPAGKAFLPGPSTPCRIRHARCPNAHCSPAPEEQNAGIYLREYAFPTAFHRQPAGKRAHSSDETPLNNPQYPPKACRHKEIPAPHAHNH